MKVVPASEIKHLSNYSAGDVVRVVQDQGQWALVSSIADHPDRNALIFLEEDGPSFAIISHPEQYQVLAFLAKPIVEVDQRGPFEPPIRDLYDANGAIIRNADGCFMNVQSYHRSGIRNRGTFDLNKAMLVDGAERLNGVAIFGKWSVYLPHELQPEARMEIAKFEWKPRA